MLEDRVVLITGATGGLGRVVAHEFARTEAALALTSTSPEALATLAEETGLPESRLYHRAADVTRPEGIQELIGEIIERWGGLHVLLNTVGTWQGGDPVHETSIEEWNRLLRINLQSAFLLSRAVLPHMLEVGWGRIVHISSKGAVQPQPHEVAYDVSKRALITLTEVIALETKGMDVTANVILPSIIDTRANRRYISQPDPSTWVAPQDIAATMRFLCADAGEAINGASIAMYGDV
jgi:NAD(P)-dependent dehydrogenase (short-subunit alcohol dehydrogenase family)